MDNLKTPAEYVDQHGELVQELPRVEVLARLHGILATYEASARAGGCLCPLSLEDAARGLSAPHRLRFGCCRDRDESPA